MAEVRSAESEQVFIALQESEGRLRAVLETAHDAIISADSRGQIVFWNHGAAAIFGYMQQEVEGQPLTLIMPERFREAHQCGMQRLLSAGRERVMGKTLELAGLRKDSTEFPLELTLSTWKRGEAVFFTAIIRDITERKALEHQLAQAQKFELIGQLAAGIAHEINTPIQYVGNNTSFIQRSVEQLNALLQAYAQFVAEARQGPIPPERFAGLDALIAELEGDYLRAETATAIEQSLEGVKRVAKIVRSIKELSHPSGDAKAPVDLNEAVESAITVASNEWKYVADLVTDFDASLPPVLGLKDELQQVIVNIIINAAQAIADVVGDGSAGKGTITVTTRRESAMAVIRIRDTGGGIAETVREKIFEPFVTTKEVGRGTGQGLAIARSIIVGKHGGALTFESQKSHGTTFIIRVPLRVTESS